MRSVASVVGVSSMSMRTKICRAPACSRMAAMLSWQNPSSIERPIWVGLSETLASSEPATIALDHLE